LDDTKSSSLIIISMGDQTQPKIKGLFMEDHIATMPIGPQKIT
jgi:hypothetical protein